MKQISSKNMAGIVCRTLNHVDERLVDHGIRVAYIVLKMLEAEGISDQKRIRDLCFLTMVHDVGAYKTEEINDMVQFETGNVWNHSIYGYLFLKYLSPFSELSSVILFHHTDYEKLIRIPDLQSDIIKWAQIVNLADRMDVCMQTGEVKDITNFLERFREKKFSSEVVDLFLTVEKKDHVLENLRRNHEEKLNISKEVFMSLGNPSYAKEEIDTYLKMIVYAIDFRSPFTVIHTITTTSISRELAVLMDLDENQVTQIYYGALLHDLGKIGIPVEILEYPGKLSPQAMKIMKTHVNITEEIMNSEIEPVVAKIALRHHEKLDGSGYPRGLKSDDLTLSERIVAIADIVSALYGRRSYKEAFAKEKIVGILSEMKENGLLCYQTVDIMIKHFDEIMENVRNTCKPVLEVYDHMNIEYTELCKICQKI
ncbi:HD-GYP domain-containing protein [Robinsoniella peoriensis]|uniref:HD-GYP domain-containing protein n=1 Tax=Robinsoniella peoriensis TaxID=180332 RepID=UPI0009F53E3D|nr:HD domain-containing phosphohydrolase [Robinsoniella peoriensis]